MLNMFEVIETNDMIDKDLLDVRTITIGIGLLDCIDTDLNKLCKNIYDKITSTAKDLVRVGDEISKDFGVPIVNKRISVTPIALVGGSACKTKEDFVQIAKTLDKAAKDLGVNFLGGYSAIVSKGITAADRLLVESIPQAMNETDFICSSVNLGSTKTGLNMDAVRLMGKIVKDTAIMTADRDSIGCAKLVVFCNAPDDNPFMAGAFHGVTEADAIINVGVSGPGVVRAALKRAEGENFEVLCETIKKTAFKITRVGQLVAREASKRLGIPFGIIDLSLAPTPSVGDSVAEILEEIGLERVGAPGTTAALALLNDQVKKGGVMASSYVGGLSGAFIPVSEDQGMIDAVNAGALTLEKLEAMTCVCSVGLDMIAIPGDTSEETIAGIIADEAAIGMINQKTTAVRLIPVIGKGEGEVVEFGGLLGYAPIMPVNSFSCEKFVNRGG
ncbi:MAG: PFL family protein [Lachnoanaerobaculum gingivalis]